MAGQLTVSKTLGGAAVSDSLAGGGTGLAFGYCNPGEYVPIIAKAANTGWQALYVKHDGADPITDVRTFIRPYGQTYGGASSSSSDYALFADQGRRSSDDANNAGGLATGLRVEQDYALTGATVFLGSRAQVKIYGRAGLGVSYETGYPLHQDALLWNNAGTPVDATGPTAGVIGALGDTLRGDTAALKIRYYLEAGATSTLNGIRQINLVLGFSFTG